MKRNVIALLLVLCLLLGGCASTQFSDVDNSTKGTTIGEVSVPESMDETEDFTTPGNDESSSGTSESAETDISNAENTESAESSDDSSSSDETQSTDKQSTKNPTETTSAPETSKTKPPVTSDEPETSKATEPKPPQTEVSEKNDPPDETTKVPETTVPPTTSKEPETTTPPESTSPPETTEPPEKTAPTETTAPPETDPPVTTSPYDYPFNPNAIRRECISIAAGYGLVLDETLTPDNSCWANPDQATPNTQGTRLKRMLAETIEYYSKDYREANGIYPYEIRCYNIYLEDMGDGTYRIYFLYMM